MRHQKCFNEQSFVSEATAGPGYEKRKEKGYTMTQHVDIWVDPACPFAWMTTQWLLQVEKIRDITPRFNTMSLTVLNEGRQELTDEERSSRMGPVRLAAAVEQRYGKDGLRSFYLAIATLRHNEGGEFGPDMYVRALEAAGLDPALADRAKDSSLDGAVRESHHAGMEPVGQDVGTPVIHFPKEDGSTSAFFGPVIVPPPTGEEAGRLWDGLSIVATTSGLYELKRSRDRRPSFLPMS